MQRMQLVPLFEVFILKNCHDSGDLENEDKVMLWKLITGLAIVLQLCIFDIQIKPYLKWLLAYEQLSITLE